MRKEEPRTEVGGHLPLALLSKGSDREAWGWGEVRQEVGVGVFSSL